MKKQSFDYFNYDDPIEFVADYIQYRKSIGLNFSYRWFSGRAGFKSPNYLHLILKRERKLNVETAIKISKAFAWPKAQAKFFLSLTSFKIETCPNRKQDLAVQIYKMRFLSQKSALANQKQIQDLYENSLNIFIRELAREGLLNRPLEIQKQFVIDCSVVSIEKSIKHLLDVKLLRIEGDYLFACGDFVSTGDEVQSELVKKFHFDMLDLAKKSLYSHSREIRDISSVSLRITPQQLSKVKEKIQEFRKELLALEQETPLDDEPVELYHVGMQAIKIAKGKFDE